MAEKSDPTKDPEFQKVVKRMLATPPKPRKLPQKKVGKTKSGARRQLQKPKT